MTTTGTIDLTAALDGLLADLAALLAGIRPDQEHLPTPCTEYSVADLRSHVVGWLVAFADGFTHAEGVSSDPGAVVVHGNGSDQARGAASRLVAALASGAAERPLVVGGAPMPGVMAARMILWEYQVHGWDLAVATGQAWRPDVTGLADSLEFAPGMLTPEFQGPGKAFGPRVDVTANASPLAELLALSGRDPGWRAPDSAG